MTPWTAACQASLCFTVSQNLLKFMSIELVMQSNYFILCCPLLLLPSVFPSIKVFSNELALHIKWPKYWSFSIRISLKYSGLISLKTACFDLLTVQETLKSLLQHPNNDKNFQTYKRKKTSATKRQSTMVDISLGPDVQGG